MEAYRDRHKDERRKVEQAKNAPFNHFGWRLSHELKALNLSDPDKIKRLADAIEREISEQVEIRLRIQSRL